MRMVFCLAIGLIGLALSVMWMPARDSQHQLAVVTEIATQGIAPRQSHARDATATTPAVDVLATVPRTFSPQTPLLARSRTTVAVEARQPAAAVQQARTEPVPALAQPVQISLFAKVLGLSSSASANHATGQTTRQTVAETVAETAPSHVRLPRVANVPAQVVVYASAVAPVATKSATLKPTTEDEIDALTRKLQRELQRVGCYAGEIDGDWGPGSKRAMTQFTQRVNATLPVEDPDYILLTLVKGQSGSVCGNECPTGQTQNDDGRCVPRAVLAHAKRAKQVTLIAQATTSRSVPQSRPARQSARATATPPQEQRRAPARIVTSAITDTITGARPATVLPGRMAIGAALPGSTPNRAPSAALTSPSPAIGAVREQRASASPGRVDSQPSTRRRSSPRRTRSASQSRTYVAYRAPRRQTYSNSRPRRSRSWTATFFDNQ